METIGQKIRDQAYKNEKILQSLVSENFVQEIKTEIKPSIEKDLAVKLIDLNSNIVCQTIISDIKQMLSKSQHFSLQGYLLALSRFANKEKSYSCIEKAFKEMKFPLSKDIQMLFDETK